MRCFTILKYSKIKHVPPPLGPANPLYYRLVLSIYTIYEGRSESFKTDAISSKLDFRFIFFWVMTLTHLLAIYYQYSIKKCKFYELVRDFISNITPTPTGSPRTSKLRLFNHEIHADNFISRFSKYIYISINYIMYRLI